MVGDQSAWDYALEIIFFKCFRTTVNVERKQKLISQSRNAVDYGEESQA